VRRDGPQRATGLPGDTSPFALGLIMRRAHDRASGELLAAIRPLGMELRHFAVLIELSKESPQSQRELGEKIGRDTAGMVRIIDDLEAAGYAVRRPHPSDRRIRAVEMTPAGLQAFDAAHEAAQPIAGQLVAHLRPGEAEQLMDLLTRFTYPAADEE
jgi:MarR family transcriptional regulator, lower aerobic nicotinate degradation pathway regulator